MKDLFTRFISQTSGELDDTQQLYLDLPKPELSKLSKIVVKFWAKDLYGKRDIFLDGKKVVYAVPGIHCDHHISVTITSKPKPRECRTTVLGIVAYTCWLLLEKIT